MSDRLLPCRCRSGERFAVLTLRCWFSVKNRPPCFSSLQGGVNPGRHYQLDRVGLYELSLFIARKKYIVLHAPRRTGKTSVLPALRNSLNAGGKVRCLDANVESGQSAGNNVDAGFFARWRTAPGSSWTTPFWTSATTPPRRECPENRACPLRPNFV